MSVNRSVISRSPGLSHHGWTSKNVRPPDINIVYPYDGGHAHLWKTQRYLGKVNDSEAIRWIETLYG